MRDDSNARSPDGLHESWHGLSREERRRPTAENKHDWLEFPGLSGTHLSWRKEESGSWELLSDSGAIWATRRRNSITASGQNYEIRHVMKSKRRNFILDRVLRKELVDSAGSAVLSWTGGHYTGKAGTVLSIGGRNYAFPLRGSKYNAKTVMPAVEVGGSGSPIARFRLTCGWYRAAQGRNPRPVEVVVSPDSLPDHQMALVVAVASPWLRSWFDSPRVRIEVVQAARGSPKCCGRRVAPHPCVLGHHDLDVIEGPCREWSPLR